MLVLLDLSAAFDTTDHCILPERLKSGFGIRGTALSWFAPYLSNRSQQILIDSSLSMNFELTCGVPQGSCLCPLLFVLYASKIFKSWTNICLAFTVMQMTANFICPSAPMLVLTKRLLWLEWKAVFMIFVIGC